MKRIINTAIVYFIFAMAGERILSGIYKMERIYRADYIDLVPHTICRWEHCYL